MRLYRGEDAGDRSPAATTLHGRALPGRHVRRRAGPLQGRDVAEIEAQGWSLNPGRYVGTAAVDEDDGDFAERLAELYDEFTRAVGRGGGAATQGRCACGWILERVSEWREVDAR